MSDETHITPDEHRRQIELYTSERAHYITFARTLRGILERACAVSLPEAFVQARAKTVSSFAEKCVRRYDTYKDPVHDMTDLCGARVIVQTLEQVEAVKLFIEANFRVHEKDEKGTRLGDDRFGYRDVHYVVSLREERAADLGVAPGTLRRIGHRKAELQVRTWLEHAWADTLHDRIYKSPLPPSSGIKRTGNLLAALMEEGDRNFDSIAREIDGMAANYAAFAAKSDVRAEIAVQQLILQNEPDDAKKPVLALTLARLLSASGDWQSVVDLLDPYREVRDANRCERLVRLGSALCRQHRSSPAGADYRRGLSFLEESRLLCQCAAVPFVPNLRRRASLRGRVLARLAWALEVVPTRKNAAADLWHQALEHEPGNPYYLAGMLSFDAVHSRQLDVAGMRATVRQAIGTCQAHAAAGIEMPQACFAAGRLALFLGDAEAALCAYARGVRYVLDGTRCLPPGALSDEALAVSQFLDTRSPPHGAAWVADLLAMATGLLARADGPHGVVQPPKAIIIAGGAGSLAAAAVDHFRPLIEAALGPFTGLAISGGTTAGVPGCVGEVTRALRARSACAYRLIGYIPERLPADAVRDTSYDLREAGEKDFSACQVLAGWRDLLAAGVAPREVLCLGFGGGKVSALEYRIALALGATVAVVPANPAVAGDAAAVLAADPLWSALPNLFPIPLDPPTVRALVVVPKPDYAPGVLQAMAAAFHEEYVRNSTGRLPANMRPWRKLADTYRTANLEQAKYAVQVLESCGFAVQPAVDPGRPVIFSGFTEGPDGEVERMAEMEHGRWNVERLRDGWRYARERDDARKLHPCLVPWTELTDGPDGVKKYDRDAVRRYPEILAQAGLEVRRA